MRLIDADILIQELNDGFYVYCQENKQDIIDAIQCQPTIERPQGKWYDFLSKELLKARHGNHVVYRIDYLLDHLAREIYILEGFKKVQKGTKGYKRVQNDVDQEV